MDEYPTCFRKALAISIAAALSSGMAVPASAMPNMPTASNPLSPVRGTDSKPAVAHLVIVNARIIELNRQCHNSG
jgi:hypothetical protein